MSFDEMITIEGGWSTANRICAGTFFGWGAVIGVSAFFVWTGAGAIFFW